MKTKVLSIIIVLFTISIFEAKAQFTFSLGTGLQQNSATFGYRIKKFEPQLSLSGMHVGINFNESGLTHDSITGDIVSYNDKIKLSGTIYMPSVGVKYSFLENEKLKAYGVLSFTKVFVRAKLTDNSDPTANADLQEQLKKVKLFGGRLGFGTEYFFDKQFSIGGEFGIMMIRVNYKDAFDDEIYDFNTGDYVPNRITQSAKIGISPTYGKMSMNFYFGK